MMEEFIRSVTQQIRCVRARAGIAKELADHIEDQAAAYEAEGESHEAAVKRAVKEMGDPVMVGVELDRIHRPQTDFKMIGMAFVFSIAGFFVLFELNGLSQYPEHFMRLCVVLLLSFGVMAGIYFLDYSFIGQYAWGIYVFVTIAACIGQRFSAQEYAPITFMLAYLYVPIYGGILYRLRGRGYSAVGWGIGLQIVTMILAHLTGATWSVSFNICLMCAVLLVTAVWKDWFAVDRKIAIAVIIGVLALAPALLIVRAFFFRGGYGYWTQRLWAWLSPASYANESGYVYLCIRQELGAAKFIGASNSALLTGDVLIGNPMPYRTEPFVLLQLISTYGILAGLALVVALAAVILRAFRIVRNQKNQLGFMISEACFMVFLVNCLEGVLINTGLFPVSVMQLPFVSYGACTAMTYAVMIGLLFSVHRNERIITEEAVRRPVWRLSIKWEKR